MKQVTINVYEFNELSEKVQAKVKENATYEIVENHFSIFEEYCSEFLSAEYGIIAKPEYQFDNSQNDGFRFRTEQFFTPKVVELLKKKLPSADKKILDILLKKDIMFSYTPFYQYGPKASEYDIHIDNKATLADDIVASNPGLSYNETLQSIRAIEKAAVCLYLDICNDLYLSGYDQYRVSDEELLEAVNSYYYYKNGTVYDLKESVS